MTAAPTETPSWSRVRWSVAIGVLFAAQIASVMWLSRKPEGPAAASTPKTTFRFVAAPVTEKQLFETLLASDPTLFVLPTKDSFSGEAWLKNKPLNYEPADWDEPPRFLTLNTNALGNSFLAFVQTNKPPQLELGGKLPIEQRRTVAAQLPAVERRSTLEAEGEIVARLSLARIDLPVWTNAEPLLDTMVELAANGVGEVVSARLLSPRSGLASADQTALRVAQNLLVKPVDGSPGATNLARGTITFHWHTVPVPGTNNTNGTGVR